ncbi:unnamed protein product [Closterium sp. NIES-65]|nr:unnamed protein product [Closterium sp. NIES-65]
MRRGAEDQRSSLDTIEGSFDEFNAKALMLVGASSGEEERRRTEAGEKTRRREEEQERRGAPSNTWKVATLRFYLAWIAGCCSALTDSLLASLAGSLDCVGRCSRRRAAEQRRGAEEQKTRAAEEQRSIFEHMEGCKRSSFALLLAHLAAAAPVVGGWYYFGAPSLANTRSSNKAEDNTKSLSARLQASAKACSARARAINR